MSVHSLFAFAGLCALLALAPGPDTFLVLRFSMRGTRAGLGAGVGSALGSLLWAAAVAGGLALLLTESATAYRVVKIVCGLYLLYLGLNALLRKSATHTADGDDASQVQFATALRTGLLSCALNPKVGLFFLAIVPQFLPDGHASIAATMTLGLIDATIALAYFFLLALLAGQAMRWLRTPRVARTLDRLAAAVLAAFGIGTIATADL